MANVTFFLRSKNKNAKINVRFSIARGKLFRASTPLTVNPEHFNQKTGRIRRLANFKDKDSLQSKLSQFEAFLISRYNEDLQKKSITGAGWLQECINEFFKITKIDDLDRLYNYSKHYIKLLKTKNNLRTGQTGVAKSTVTKYKTIANKIKGFEQHKRHKYLISEVGQNFRDDFIKYLLEVEKLGLNTTGRYIKFIKTICLHAQRSGLITSNELQYIKGFEVATSKIILTKEDLQKIEKLNLINDRLKAVRDWLLIGCYIGQRVGDLLSLKASNLTTNGNLSFIELIQQKTKKRVSILIHPKIKDIINKYKGFPDIYNKYSLDSAKTKFNLDIKEVCRLAGINEITKGAKVNPKTNRKEKGEFPKYELVTSHICRRSFASNHYAEMPTALIMSVTGHTTESEFLKYIGKTNIDYATEMAKYWNIESQKQAIKDGEQSPLKIAK